MLTGDPSLRTAFAWESLIDEAVFIVGPPLATIVALQLFPAAASILATTLLVVGTLLLLTQRSTEPVPSGRAKAKGGRPAILLPGVFGITAIFALMGGIFGAFEVTTVAYAKEAGHAGVAGLLLALYAFGSLLAGLVFGVAKLEASLLKQFGVAIAALAVVTLPLPFLPNICLDRRRPDAGRRGVFAGPDLRDEPGRAHRAGSPPDRDDVLDGVRYGRRHCDGDTAGRAGHRFARRVRRVLGHVGLCDRRLPGVRAGAAFAAPIHCRRNRDRGRSRPADQAVISDLMPAMVTPRRELSPR